MSDLSDYLDLRELHDDFAQHICPYCGVKRWFKQGSEQNKHCRTCGGALWQPLEYVCLDCETRMVADGKLWRCNVCNAAEPLERDALAGLLTGEFETVTGYDRGAHRECPVCGERGVRCGPDGVRKCTQCETYIGYRFGESWFAYAEWLRDPVRVRVTEDGGRDD